MRIFIFLGWCLAIVVNFEIHCILFQVNTGWSEGVFCSGGSHSMRYNFFLYALDQHSDCSHLVCHNLKFFELFKGDHYLLNTFSRTVVGGYFDIIDKLINIRDIFFDRGNWHFTRFRDRLSFRVMQRERWLLLVQDMSVVLHDLWTTATPYHFIIKL